jgi:predicted enzyme related to lactoylglutathione lyase
MKKTIKLIIGVGAVLLAFTGAHADVSIRAIRLGAKDIPAAEKFYEQAFGLREIRRVHGGAHGDLLEVVLAFGDSVDSAKSSPGTRLTLMELKAGSVSDVMPHLIFNVSDMAAASAAVQTAGGALDGKLLPLSDGGSVQFVVDPAGNHFELIYIPNK